jgi:hypothetical protein
VVLIVAIFRPFTSNNNADNNEKSPKKYAKLKGE